MLVGAQIIQDRNLDEEICAVYTNGSSVKGVMLKWFKEHAQAFEFLLIRDPGEAGSFWESSLKDALGNKTVCLTPPDNMDPDEAFLSDWWPSSL